MRGPAPASDDRPPVARMEEEARQEQRSLEDEPAVDDAEDPRRQAVVSGERVAPAGEQLRWRTDEEAHGDRCEQPGGDPRWEGHEERRDPAAPAGDESDGQDDCREVQSCSDAVGDSGRVGEPLDRRTDGPPGHPSDLEEGIGKADEDSGDADSSTQHPGSVDAWLPRISRLDL